MKFQDLPHHFNCRCVVIKIHVLNLPPQDWFVIGGRPREKKQWPTLIGPRVKILFGPN